MLDVKRSKTQSCPYIKTKGKIYRNNEEQKQYLLSTTENSSRSLFESITDISYEDGLTASNQVLIVYEAFHNTSQDIPLATWSRVLWKILGTLFKMRQARDLNFHRPRHNRTIAIGRSVNAKKDFVTGRDSTADVERTITKNELTGHDIFSIVSNATKRFHNRRAAFANRSPRTSDSFSQEVLHRDNKAAYEMTISSLGLFSAA